MLVLSLWPVSSHRLAGPQDRTLSFPRPVAWNPTVSTGVLDRHTSCLCLITQDCVQPQVNLGPGQFLHPSLEAEQSHSVFPEVGGVCILVAGACM